MLNKTSRWKFPVAVMLPVIAALLVTIGLAAAFVLWSAARTDERSLARQQALAARMIETAKSDFEATQTEQVQRYDAVDVFLGGRPDPDDIDDYFGEDEYDTYGHDRVYVLDPDLNPVYAANAGTRVESAAYDRDRALVAPLAAALRTPEIEAAVRSYEDGDSDTPPQLADFVTVGGRVALLGVVPIVSNWDDQTQQPGHYYYHVAMQFVGSELARDLMDEYLLEGVHFDTAASPMPGEAMVPVANAAGRFVAWFKWRPDLPGRALLNETLPASVGLLAVLGAIIALLLWRLARSTRALDRARSEALFRATHDPLTGLANRALFTERLQTAPLPLTLLALDLDRFKAVNDTLGHEAGDELLRQVATRLAPLVRASDLVARLGGDEFMILVSGDMSPSAAVDLAGRIVTAISHPFLVGGESVQIGVSVGIATALSDERSDLVARADFALYDAKESGRNTYRLFEARRQAA